MSKQYRVLYLFILPGAVLLILFHYLPIYGITIAFKDFKPMLGIAGSEWVGFQNFIDAFNSIFFWRVLRNTLTINILQLLFGFPAPIILAVLLNEIRFETGKRVIQTITYLPHFLSWVVVGGFVASVLSPNQGVIALVSEALTGTRADVFPLIEPGWFPWIIVGSGIWQSVGWGSIIYIAAISGINPELYEACIIDGGNRWHQIWNITIPSIMPTIFVLLILRIGRLLGSNFEQIYVLLNPSVYSTGDVISTYVFREGIGKGSFSFTATIGLFQSLIGFVLMLIANAASKRLGRSLW